MKNSELNERHANEEAEDDVSTILVGYLNVHEGAKQPAHENRRTRLQPKYSRKLSGAGDVVKSKQANRRAKLHRQTGADNREKPKPES